MKFWAIAAASAIVGLLRADSITPYAPSPIPSFSPVPIGSFEAASPAHLPPAAAQAVPVQNAPPVGSVQAAPPGNGGQNPFLAVSPAPTPFATAPPVAPTPLPAPQTGAALSAPPASALWRGSQQQIAGISSRENNGSLTHAQAIALRAEVRAIRVRNGLQRASDASKLSRARRLKLDQELRDEQEKIRLASTQP
jgi:hypothetical protein